MDSSIIEMETIARRVKGDDNLMSQFTPVDWVVLDFANGRRSFKDLATMLPTEQSALMASFRHLKALGFLAWNELTYRNSRGDSSSGIRRNATQPIKVAEVLSAVSDVSVIMADLSDEQCLQYIPRKLLGAFRSFTPHQVNATYEMDLGTQALVEFLFAHINGLTPYEILGVESSASDAEIRQAYLKRSRLFHPDRYYRKNIGVFTNQLTALFKAVTTAFGTLNP